MFAQMGTSLVDADPSFVIDFMHSREGFPDGCPQFLQIEIGVFLAHNNEVGLFDFGLLDCKKPEGFNGPQH
jgi:hypothetical protein